MGELLHGRWQLTATKSVGGMRESVVIAGSNSSDGRHEVRLGTPLRLDVNGGEWGVSLHVFLSNGWDEIDRLQRKTQIVPGQGLTVVVSSGEPSDSLSSLKVRLVSRPGPEPAATPAARFLLARRLNGPSQHRWRRLLAALRSLAWRLAKTGSS